MNEKDVAVYGKLISLADLLSKLDTNAEYLSLCDNYDDNPTEPAAPYPIHNLSTKIPYFRRLLVKLRGSDELKDQMNQASAIVRELLMPRKSCQGGRTFVRYDLWERLTKLGCVVTSNSSNLQVPVKGIVICTGKQNHLFFV